MTAGTVGVGIGDAGRVDGVVVGVASPLDAAGRRSCSSGRRGASAASVLREGPGSELRRAFRPPSSDDIRRGGVAPPCEAPGETGDVGVVGARRSRSSSMAPALVDKAGKPAGGVVIVMGAVLQ
ncbi:hypothetical protein ACQ859_17820 [Roseateles chitinivorans]|uniref:hypothetical protein n=1 Tax=Roseateles chitinivorans TaxID=2917965 RepID=UPI003D66E3A7